MLEVSRVGTSRESQFPQSQKEEVRQPKAMKRQPVPGSPRVFETQQQQELVSKDAKRKEEEKGYAPDDDGKRKGEPLDGLIGRVDSKGPQKETYSVRRDASSDTQLGDTQQAASSAARLAEEGESMSSPAGKTLSAQ